MPRLPHKRVLKIHVFSNTSEHFTVGNLSKITLFDQLVHYYVQQCLFRYERY